MFWNEAYYIDTRLLFGSRSSLFIFNTFADALAWIGIPYLLHYLDNFFVAAISNLQQYMSTFQRAFTLLGVPLAPDKIVGPTTSLTYLGIDIDSTLRAVIFADRNFRGWQVQKL